MIAKAALPVIARRGVEFLTGYLVIICGGGRGVSVRQWAWVVTIIPMDQKI